MSYGLATYSQCASPEGGPCSAMSNTQGSHSSKFGDDPVKVPIQTFRTARDSIIDILLNKIDNAIQPMDARLAANEMTEAAFDAVDPSREWRHHFEADIAVLGLD